MADNTTLNAGTGGDTIATDDIGGVKYQRVKLTTGADGVATDVSTANPVPVSDAGGSLTVDGTVAVSGTTAVSAASLPLPSGAATETSVAATASAAGATTDAEATVNGSIIAVLKRLRTLLSGGLPAALGANGGLKIEGVASGTTVPVDDGGGSLTVDGSVTATLGAGTANIGDVDVLTVPAPLSTTGGGTEATALRVTVASDSTGVLSVDDNGGSLTVDGTVAVSGTVATTLSGSPTVDTELTTADLDTGAGTDTRAVVGLALAASGGALLVGSANPVPISDNSGSITVDDGAGSLTVDGTVAATQSGTWTLGANSGVDVGDVTINNASGASAVNIQDGGNSITVDGTVTANLAAGTNNIGDVDVLSVPAPLSTTGGGTEATALRVTVATDSTGVLSVDDNGGSLTVDVGAALPAGTNAIGKLAANSGVDIGDVDVTSISAGTNTIGDVGIKPRTSGGLTPYRNIDLDEADVAVKASPGQLFGWYMFNAAATTRYVKFYDASTASVTVGTTTPVLTIPIPAGAAANVFSEIGIPFATAITAACTTGVADADTGAPAANDVQVNFFYA